MWYMTVVSSVQPGSSDLQDFEALYVQELPGMLALALSLTGSREAAADVVQEAFLRAYARWPRVSTLEKPAAWVRRVLLNLATDVFRRASRERRAVGRLASESDQVFEEPEIDQFWAAVRGLPHRQRCVVALRYAGDHSVQDIASVLEVSVGTVTRSLSVARKKLALRLACESEDT